MSRRPKRYRIVCHDATNDRYETWETEGTSALNAFENAGIRERLGTEVEVDAFTITKLSVVS